MILLDELLAQAGSQLNSALFLTPPYHKGGKTVLFRKPAAVITCCRPEDAGHALAEAERAVQSGLTGYGLINYETGFLFEKRLHPLLQTSERPLFRFCFFEPEQTAVIDSAALSLWNDDEPEGGYSVEDVVFNTSKEKYINDIGRIKDYIAEGDTYQVNYTMQAEFGFEGSAAALFKKLLFNQSAKYTAYINTPDKYVLSLSPELFFKTDNRRIETRPMKGTARRGLDAASDSRAEEQLYNSSKDRAENIMIVDLLRNDLGRISRFGSVRTKNIFDIEKYESVFQMVSTVRGILRRDTRLPEILKEIFPCGSITGAPKIRTMEIIHELEGRERGLYTGAVGIVSKDSTVFNVAIRTVEIEKASGKGSIGIGSGVVWDSDPEKEYHESVAKSSFLLNPMPYFKLIETMRVQKGKVMRLRAHLKRLRGSAEYFLFVFDKKKVVNEINKALEQAEESENYKLRITLSKEGRITAELSGYPGKTERARIAVSDKRADSGDRFLYHKTTNRELYRSEFEKYAQQGYFEVIFMNERGEITEGSFNNIFILREGRWYTPPVSSGLLPGVYRNRFISQTGAEEKVLYPEDLRKADKIILTNSLRGRTEVLSFEF